MVRKPSRKQQGLTIVDALITLCLIGIMIGIVIPKYQRLAKEAQESAVKAELANIRTSINLFRALNEHNPASLNDMLEKKVLLPGRVGEDEYTQSFFDRQYLTVQEIDNKGNILDAFGNSFLYDPVRGEVRSTTRGYENW